MSIKNAYLASGMEKVIARNAGEPEFHQAVKEVLEISDFISSKDGGNGAVREFIEWII